MKGGILSAFALAFASQAYAFSIDALVHWSNESRLSTFARRVIQVGRKPSGITAITIPVELTYVNLDQYCTEKIDERIVSQMELRAEWALNKTAKRLGVKFDVITTQDELDFPAFHVLVADVHDPLWRQIQCTLRDSTAGIGCAFDQPVFLDNPSERSFSAAIPFRRSMPETFTHELGHFALGHTDGYVRSGRRTSPLPGLEQFNSANKKNPFHRHEIQRFLDNLS